MPNGDFLLLITGYDITGQHLLTNTNVTNLRGSSYYLRIHSIIPAGEAAKEYDPSKPKRRHTLEPGGLAWVISEETFQIKKNSITALVTLRSSFTKQGMLALDVGLVDANFFGPIGSLVINFSSKPIVLSAGKKFFRVLFLEHSDAVDKQVPETLHYDHEAYASKILEDMVGSFSSTFLQTAEMEKRIEDRLKSGLVDKLEPNILEKLAYHIFKNNYGKLLVLFLLLAGVANLFKVGSYFHTESEIREIIEDYRTEKQETNP